MNLKSFQYFLMMPSVEIHPVLSFLFDQKTLAA